MVQMIMINDDDDAGQHNVTVNTVDEYTIQLLLLSSAYPNIFFLEKAR